MSVLLLAQTRDHIRSQFSPQQVVDVGYYGGEFSSEEVTQSSYKTPAILIAGLGWSRPRGGERMLGRNTRVVHMAAFVVTSNGNRQDRMLEAQGLAEMLDLALEMWLPANAEDAVIELAAVEPNIRCENIYNRKIDARGQALWLVSWQQCVKPQRPLPEIYDLLGVEITNYVTQPTAPAPSPEPVALTVTEDIHFDPKEP